MLTPDEWSPSRLRDLTEQECRGLLHEHRIGRVAWCAADGPAVLPVNYLSDGDSVLFRTSPHTQLARRFSPGPVAFEIDAFDEATRSGWSVVVRGPPSSWTATRCRRRTAGPIPGRGVPATSTCGSSSTG